MGVIYYALTDVGRRRKENQDAVLTGELPPDERTGSERHLLAVADGVGGRDRGGWASKTSLAVLCSTLPPLLGDREPGEALRLAVEAANTAVWEAEAKRASGERSAASTLVALVVEPSRLWWANVGDSRAYLVRGERGRQLTRDHSWVAEQVAAGYLSQLEAKQHPRKNVLHRAVGIQSDVAVDTAGPISLIPEDSIVLCSDGLHGPLADEEIVAVAGRGSPRLAAEVLVNLSNDRGGPDNISVVVCQVSADVSAVEPHSTAPGEPASTTWHGSPQPTQRVC